MEKDDDFFDDDFTDYRFNEILFELEANGTILRQWENGEPDGIEPKTETETKKPVKNEKRKTIQR